MTLRRLETVMKKICIKPQIWAIVVLAVTTSGCAGSNKTLSSKNQVLVNSEYEQRAEDEDFDFLEDELTAQRVEISDPLEPFNRIMYNLNDTLYFWVLKPCTQAYKQVIPKPARIGIHNFFQNLAFPIRYVNCLLQGKSDAAGTESDRFLINTTAGILGFGDPAGDKYGLQPVDEDLGQTLAIHGINNGFYIVWPILGPSTVRDSAGMVGDLFLNPVFYVEPIEAKLGISAGGYTNENSFHIGEYEVFKSAAVDPYVAMREVYIQYQNKKVQE